MTTPISSLTSTSQTINGNDPSQRHPAYTIHYNQVQLVNDIFNGIDTAKEYIFQFPQELDDTFTLRKDRATLRNFVKRAVEAFVGMIFRKPMQVNNYPPKTTKLFHTIDTKNSIELFTKQTTENVTKDGKAFILVDAPSDSSNGQPYLLNITRNAVINWRKDSYDKFTMVVIEEIVAEPNGAFGTKYTLQWRHYSFTDEEEPTVVIRIWKKDTTNNKDSFKVEETIDTTFTEIPLIEVDVDAVPLLYDTAKMNVKFLNRQSHKDRYLTMAALPIPVIWGADIDDDGNTTTAKPALVIGVDEAFIFNGTKDEADFQWRELSGTSVDLLQADLDAITEDITTGILRAAETANAVQKTATEVQLLQAEASNRVTTIANAVEIAMQKALSIFVDMNNETLTDDAMFQLSKDFNSSLMGSDGARIALESYLLGLLSMETFLQTLSDMELVNIGSAADEMARIQADSFKPIPRTEQPLKSTDNRTKSAMEN